LKYNVLTVIHNRGLKCGGISIDYCFFLLNCISTFNETTVDMLLHSHTLSTFWANQSLL